MILLNTKIKIDLCIFKSVRVFWQGWFTFALGFTAVPFVFVALTPPLTAADLGFLFPFSVGPNTSPDKDLWDVCLDLLRAPVNDRQHDLILSVEHLASES